MSLLSQIAELTEAAAIISVAVAAIKLIAAVIGLVDELREARRK